MPSLIITPDDFMPDRDEPKPENSFILFQLIEGESYMLTKWVDSKEVPTGVEFGEMFSEGGSADIESEAGMLDFAVAEMLTAEDQHPGWYVMEDFYGHYTRDYYGEVDCDYSCEVVRPATREDMDRFGLTDIPLDTI